MSEVPIAAHGRWTAMMLWGGALAAAVALSMAGDLLPWAFKYPRAWVVPLSFWISDFKGWLINDASFGLFTFQELTRSISWLVEWPFKGARSLLSAGFVKGFGNEAVLLWPRISWIALIAIVALMAHFARNWKLALMVGLSFFYLALFGQWEAAMQTLSSIVIAVPLGVVGGLAIGITAFRHPLFEKAITPILDLMQTVPVFAYLVPILVLFGFNPVAAMIATIIYAMPPMVRNTVLALRRVPDEIVDFGNMAGCSRRQMTWKIMVPAARPTLMLGVNQVIMLSLNMVIIASMIGARGLGQEVLVALRKLDFGGSLVSALAIVLLAIALDRLAKAVAQRPPRAHVETTAGWLARHPYMAAVIALLAGTWAAGLGIPAVQNYPEAWEVTTGTAVNDAIKWINVNFFDYIEAVKTWLLLNLMVPFKRFLLALPWPAVIGLVALAGWRLGGWRLALLTGSLAVFIAVTGNWPKAMITIYLCGFGVLIASMIGVPIGVWAARNDRVNQVVQPIIDTLQTIPMFAFLIPAVMLFRVGDFAALLAVVAYAVVSPTRYTIHGIRQIEPALIEAALAAGCTKRQLLWKVQVPLALPEIMLGVNQTIMLALSMLVITALVGTRDLGQEVYIALTKADVGRGIVAGLCVAFIAIIADRLIGAWARRRKQQLGFE